MVLISIIALFVKPLFGESIGETVVSFKTGRLRAKEDVLEGVRVKQQKGIAPKRLNQKE